MNRIRRVSVAAAALSAYGGVMWVVGHEVRLSLEEERRVTEKEVPPAALATLQRLAAGAAITELAEEKEHGGVFYEGSWKSADGKVDCLVTPTGDVVEIEESMPDAKIPEGVRAAAAREAGADAKPHFERKTLYLYEIHYRKDNRGHEAIFTADGRKFHEEQDEGEDQDEAED